MEPGTERAKERPRQRVQVRPLEVDELDDAAALLGRGMADNPMHVAVYGGDDASRERAHGRLMGVLLSMSPATTVDAAVRDGQLVGVAAAAPPGHCRPGPAARLALVGCAAALGPRVAVRLVAWSRGWAAHDPAEPHVHLGPVSVDRGRRGEGIGHALLTHHVGHLDAAGLVGHLETDRPEAVGFYRRFGFDVVREHEVLGVRTWFMRREPARPVPAGSRR